MSTWREPSADDFRTKSSKSSRGSSGGEKLAKIGLFISVAAVFLAIFSLYLVLDLSRRVATQDAMIESMRRELNGRK
jgi:hypothetical protein